VGVGDRDKVETDIEVFVNVTLAILSSPLTGIIKTGVGEKKSRAKAPCVSERSRGVDVAVNLGARTISS